MNFKIGDRVQKKSGKPFKSKEKTATIKGFQINYNDPKERIAASFEEDGSIVGLGMLKYEQET